MRNSAVAALTLLTGALAHNTMWHPAMYGWNKTDDIFNPMLPLSKLKFKDWWFHGGMDDPPPPGHLLQIPAGGKMTANIHCGKDHTEYGAGLPDFGPGSQYMKGEWADRVCAPHSTDKFESNAVPLDAKGCSIAIAYESDPAKVKPEDVVVISTNHTCPWYLKTDFAFPPDLPPCPPGGCHCFWGWIHSAGGGAGSPDQIYHSAYRCNVTNANPAACALPKPQPARKCPTDKNNCTIGAKTPFYWLQAEGNNNFQDGGDPPFYNDEYGFMDGAQTDLWLADVDHSEYNPTNISQWAPNNGVTYYTDYKAPAVTPYSKPAPTSITTCPGNTAQATAANWVKVTAAPNEAAAGPEPTATISSAARPSATSGLVPDTGFAESNSIASAAGSDALSSVAGGISGHESAASNPSSATTGAPGAANTGPLAVNLMPVVVPTAESSSLGAGVIPGEMFEGSATSKTNAAAPTVSGASSAANGTTTLPTSGSTKPKKCPPKRRNNRKRRLSLQH